MNKHLLIGVMGAVALSALPVSASTAYPTFNFTQGLWTSGGQVKDTCAAGTNSQCGSGASNNSDLSSYSVTPSGQSGTPIVATAYAFYVTSVAAGSGTGTELVGGGNGAQSSGNTTAVGEYSGAGLGVCENGTQTGSGQNCVDPNHQINNGVNPGSGQDYEFILIEFSAAVNLSSIQLGNYGGGNTADPFNATYYVSNSTAPNLGTALAGTSINSLAGDSFGSAQSENCTSGCAGGTLSSPTSVLETLNATDVTYLLIGASTASGQAGDDFFKIQDITVSANSQSPSTPEPATFALFGLALTGLGLYSRKRRTNN